MSFKWASLTNIFLSLFMAALLSVLFTIGQGNHISIDGYLFTFAWALAGSLVVAFVVPLPRMGGWWARQMGADAMNDKSGMPFFLDSMIQVAFFLVCVNAILTSALSGFGTIDGMSWFDRWWGMNLQFYAVAFVAYLVCCPLASAIASKITGEKKPTVVE